MPNFYNTASNSRKVAPTTNLGTRGLEFFCLAADTDFWDSGAYTDSNSMYSKAVRGIQQYAEIFFLGSPSADIPDAFVFAFASDTVTWQDDSNQTSDSSYGSGQDSISNAEFIATLAQGISDSLNDENIDFSISRLESNGDIID